MSTLWGGILKKVRTKYSLSLSLSHLVHLHLVVFSSVITVVMQMQALDSRRDKFSCEVLRKPLKNVEEDKNESKL